MAVTPKDYIEQQKNSEKALVPFNAGSSPSKPSAIVERLTAGLESKQSGLDKSSNGPAIK